MSLLSALVLFGFLVLLPSATGSACSSWCNVYTCGLAACQGCTDCTKLHQGEYCASWCNSMTCGTSVCHGCSACSSKPHGPPEPCKCKEVWTDSICTKPQYGCSTCYGSELPPGRQGSCQVANPGCVTDQKSGADTTHWSYCEPCVCKASWTYPESDDEKCAGNQNGCTNCDADPKGPWCDIVNPGCASEELSDGGGWAYCGDPCTCREKWSSPEDAGAAPNTCATTQHGCQSCDNDLLGPWCIVNSPLCATAETTSGGDWAYCAGPRIAAAEEACAFVVSISGVDEAAISAIQDAAEAVAASG